MDIFTTNVLNGVVQYLPKPTSFLLDMFFREEQTETSEEIHFDVADGKRRIAPFCSPLVAGRVVESHGHTAKTFKPAYVKDKRRFNPQRALKRAIGEPIAGAWSPQQRMEAVLRADLMDQRDMLMRRKEVMASECLRTGKVTVSGEDYPTTVVDFLRDAALTVTLTGGNRWGEAGIKPLTDLETWNTTMLQKSGANVTDWVMDVEAWKLLRADADFLKLLDRFRGNAVQTKISQEFEGASMVAEAPPWRFWVYQTWYIDPSTGSEVKMLPDHTVLGSSASLEGVRAYGAIQDEEAGIQPLTEFTKSWVDKDPGVRWLLMQSAPLIVPYRVNASFNATVR